jgi:hypothetical protein
MKVRTFFSFPFLPIFHSHPLYFFVLLSFISLFLAPSLLSSNSWINAPQIHYLNILFILGAISMCS